MSDSAIPEEAVRMALGVDGVEYVGRGGQGQVWRYESDGEQRVAKILIRGHLADTQYFEREVRAYGLIDSPYVVQFLGSERLDVAGEERMVMFFEYIDGLNLDDRVSSGDMPEEEQVKRLLLGSLRGLAAIHEQHIVHRDIKLPNILCRSDDWVRPVITDLGIVKILGEPTLTPHGWIVGSMGYVAPEVLAGRPAKQMADLWSLGVVLHILLAGTHPYGSPKTPDAAIRAIGNMTLASPVATDPLLAKLVEKFLDIRPHKRGSSAAALREVEVVWS